MPTVNWSELASMLTVLTICGSIFTWIVSVIIDRKFNAFEKALRGDFVSAKELSILIKQADESHAAFKGSIADLWEAINELREAK